jgi:hypothetical protein
MFASSVSNNLSELEQGLGGHLATTGINPLVAGLWGELES